MTQHHIHESEVCDVGIRYAVLWAHDDELGRIGYRGQVTEDKPHAWHRGEFRRQLADPDQRGELRRQKSESEARLARARETLRRERERYEAQRRESLTNGRGV
jgi:hypothetical protein